MICKENVEFLNMVRLIVVKETINFSNVIAFYLQNTHSTIYFRETEYN